MYNNVFMQLYDEMFKKYLAANQQIWKLTNQLREIKNGEYTPEPCAVVKLAQTFEVNLN